LLKKKDTVVLFLKVASLALMRGEVEYRQGEAIRARQASTGRHLPTTELPFSNERKKAGNPTACRGKRGVTSRWRGGQLTVLLQDGCVYYKLNVVVDWMVVLMYRMAQGTTELEAFLYIYLSAFYSSICTILKSGNNVLYVTLVRSGSSLVNVAQH